MSPQSIGLDLEILRRVCSDRLIRVLEDVPGAKDLIIDGDLMKMLDRIVGATLLRKHGVDKMYRMERMPPPVQNVQRVYLVRPSLLLLKTLADHVHADLTTNPDLRVHVVVMPRLMSWVTALLEEEGLYGALKIHEFCPEFIPLDDDLLSLEMTSFFRDAFLEGDFSGCVDVARAINTLQGLFGEIPYVLAHGRAAKAVVNTLDLLSNQKSPPKTQQVPEISHLFIFDRDADYVTPLLTQLTYEGALDDHFGIHAGMAEFPGEVTGQDTPRKIPLNNKETIYDNIRNKHFASVSSYLIMKVREINAKKEQAHTMTASQMKDFVANELRTLQTCHATLALHLRACEYITKSVKQDFEMQLTTEHGLVTGAGNVGHIKKFLKNGLARMLPLTDNLRLLCLYSLTQEGLSYKEYKELTSQVLAAHGNKHLITINNLRHLSLLCATETPGSNAGMSKDSSNTNLQGRLGHVTYLLPRRGQGWKAVAKRLRLVPEADKTIDLHNPSEPSYVFNGAYTPVLAKVVGEALSTSGPFTQTIEDSLKVLPGTTLSRTPTPGSPLCSRVALVVMMGGITYSEIATLRLLAVTTSTRIIVASTSTINGNQLISAVIHK